jgi:dUTP pyrophosphatase
MFGPEFLVASLAVGVLGLVLLEIMGSRGIVSTDMKVTVLQGELRRSTNDAAGYDLIAVEDRVLYIGCMTPVKTGVITQMEGVYGLIRDRSGLACKGITTRAGVIDPGYDKEWGVVMMNEGDTAYTIHKGDRIAQVLFIPTSDVIVTGEGVSVSVDNRVGGFGSTGK